MYFFFFFFFSSRRRHTRCSRDWSSDVCSSDLANRSKCSGSPASSPDTTLTLSPAGGRTNTRTNDPCRGKRGHQVTRGAAAVPCPVRTAGGRAHAGGGGGRAGVWVGEGNPPPRTRGPGG